MKSHNRLTDSPLTHFPYCQVNPGLQVWPPEVAAVQLSSWIPAQGNLLSIYSYFFWRPARSILEFSEGLQDITWSLLEASRILPGAFWKPAGSYLEVSGGMEDFTRRFLEASKILPKAFWWPIGSFEDHGISGGLQDLTWSLLEANRFCLWWLWWISSTRQRFNQ